MGRTCTFEIRAFCVVDEDDWGEPVTEQKIQQDVAELLENDLTIEAEVIVTNLRHY